MIDGSPPSRGRPGDVVSPAEPLPMQRGDASQGDGSRLRFTAIAVAALAMAALLVWSALPHPAPGPTSHAATASGATTFVSSISVVSTAGITSITAMPAFHDWHVAYVGPDEAMHAVSIYGGQAVGALPAPGILETAADLNEFPRLAALSPDSHYLAYSSIPASSPSASSGPIMLLDVNAPSLPHPYAGTKPLHAQNLFWSPDSSKLAFESNRNGAFAIYSINPKGLPPQAVPGVSDGTNGIYRLLGWIDVTHLAVLANHQGTAVLGALDVSTGELRFIAQLTACCLNSVYLAPDGARAVVDGTAGGTAVVEVVDTATGATRVLPNLTRWIDPAWSTIAWKPGDHVLAVTASTTAYGPGNSAGPAVQLLDLDHDTFDTVDTVDTVTRNEYALGWSPDGQSLIVGTPTNLTGKPTGDLSIMTFRRKGVIDSMTLTRSAAAFLGFIRTA